MLGIQSPGVSHPFKQRSEDGFSAEVGNLYLVKKGLEWVLGDIKARNLRGNLAT